MRMCNLCLHAGAREVKREKLASIPTPLATKDWCPVSHEAFVSTVQKVLADGGMNVVTSSHALTRDGLRYFGLMQVTRGDDESRDFGLVIGARNSHDKSFAAALALGASVFVCDNLSFVGEVKLARKHTRFINRDLPGLVSKAMAKLDLLRGTQEGRFRKYKDVECSDQKAHDFFIRSLDHGVITPTRIRKLMQEWRNPRHPEFKDKNMWSLMNAYTEVLKGNLTDLPDRTIKLQGMLDIECGITVKDNVIQMAQAV